MLKKGKEHKIQIIPTHLKNTFFYNYNTADVGLIHMSSRFHVTPDVPKYRSHMITSDTADGLVCSYKNSNHALLSNRSSHLTTNGRLSV